MNARIVVTLSRPVKRIIDDDERFSRILTINVNLAAVSSQIKKSSNQNYE
jgi:hypothetical protein